MATATRQQGQTTSAYAGLDFIKAAFCPLEFTATKLKDHPSFAQLRKDKALATLEVGDQLHYPRQFPFTDANGHRKTGTQIITAPFGLAPKDFDLFLGLYTYLRRLPELPADGRTHMTVDFLARQLGLPATCQKDYLRIRSRIFRFSFVKYTNSAFWNSGTKTYDIVNFGFFNIAALSRVTESRRPVSFEWDPSFLRLVESSAYLAFDYQLYCTLSPTLRRLYLIANRDGWNQRDSSVFSADQFAIHQIGYSGSPDRKRDRLHKLRHLLSQAEDLALIRPCPSWGGYFKSASRGTASDSLLLRWSRGPNLKTKENAPTRPTEVDLSTDALYAQVKELRDEEKKPLHPTAYKRLIDKYGRQKIQKHILVILAQKEHRPKSFQKSQVAAFINRLQNDHPEPDWYQDLKRAERLSLFEGSQPNQLSMNLYGTFFRE
jgi:hypothetical protein